MLILPVTKEIKVQLEKNEKQSSKKKEKVEKGSNMRCASHKETIERVTSRNIYMIATTFKKTKTVRVMIAL